MAPITRLRTAACALLLWAGSAQAGEFRIAYSSNPGSLPIVVADEQGYFAAEGVTLRRVACETGRECLRRLLDGQADLSTTADLPLVLAAFAGDRFSIVATINVNRNDTKLVTRRGSGVQAVADLAGRRVGTLLGTTAQYALDSLLLFEGVDTARVAVVGLAPSELRAALLARRIDAAAVFEPIAFDIAQGLGAEAVVLGSASIYAQSWNLVAAPPGAAPRPPEVAGVLRALQRASAWIATQPAAAQALLQRRSGLSAELVEQSWPFLGYSLELRQSLLTTMEGQARWARRVGLVEGPTPNFLGFVDARPLRALRPAAVTLAH